MRIPKYQPYEEPPPRRAWSRDELRAAVQTVRAMAADEAVGKDPRRAERIAALAEELGRDPKTVRPRLANVAYVLGEAGMPVPACLRPMGSVGRRTVVAILDIWHEIDAEEDLAAGQAIARREWTEDELAEALAACRRMAAAEARLGRSLSLDEVGDVICEAAARLGRRWSETRQIMCAADELADEPNAKDVASDAGETELTEAEREALRRLLRGDGRG